MKSLTSHERFRRILNHQEADRVPIWDFPWPGALARWRREGMPEAVSFVDYFDLDRVARIEVDNSPRYPERVVEETDEYKIYTTRWGAVQKDFKQADSTPEFIGYTVTTPEKWQKAKRRMTPGDDRIPWDDLKANYGRWRDEGYWIDAKLTFGFDAAHALTVGFEPFLTALVERPEWCADMFNHYLDVALALQDRVWQAEFGGRVRAIGAGFGGVLESSTGRICISVQVPGWQDFPLADWLQDRFGLPSLVANDTVAGGYAELCRGAGVDARHFFYSNIGSGIGGALFVDRVPYDGLGMGAAYIGHTYVPDWTSPSPGREAKLENLCSGWSIERRLCTPGYVPSDSALAAMCRGDVGTITCAMLGEAARGGDEFAVAEIERIALSYATALSNLITLVSPDVVAIGGGVANLGDVLLDPIRRFTDQRVFISAQGAYRIVACEFMDAAVPIGAALLARDRLRHD